MVNISPVSFSGKQQRTDNKNSRIKGGMQIAAGGYLASKAVTSGLRRMLGIRIEEHTTTSKNARDIIKGGCILDPKFGGSGFSVLDEDFLDESKNYIHITGMPKDLKARILSHAEESGVKMDEATIKKMDKAFSPFSKGCITASYRKIQKFSYRCKMNKVETLEQMKKQGVLDDVFVSEFIPAKMTLPNVLNILFGIKSKTFYIPGDEEYFNKNFIEDASDFALKTDKPLKVCRTKIGAMFEGLKNHGLSGMKQNKTRVAAGVAIFAALSFVSYKLIKSGTEKLKNAKETVKN